MNKRNNRPGFAHMGILVIILVIALIGTLGFVYYQNFVQKKDSTSSVKTKDETKSNTAPTAEASSPTSNWTSASLGDISFKYQPDWKYKYDNNQPDGAYIQTDVKEYNELNKGYFYVNISISRMSTKETNLENAIDSFVSQVSTSVSSSNRQDIKVNDKPAIRYDNAGCPGCKANQVYFLAGGNLYLVQDTAYAGMSNAQAYLQTFNDKFDLFLNTIRY